MPGLLARDVVPAQFRVSKATLYRFFKRQGLDEDSSPPVDRRRFEAELPNDIWQSDAMHAAKVLVDGKLRKTYLFAFIDDMSRFIPHAQFYLNEGVESYTDAVRQALAKRGLPRKLYVDNGPAFASSHLGHVTASLGIVLVHSKPYQPEGRGKIERWFRTVRERFLSLTPDGLPLNVLNRQLAEWIENDYHTRPHASTGSSIEVYRQIAMALDNDGRFVSVARLTKTIRDILLDISLRKMTPVLLIDEANLMRLEVFAELQTLGQFDFDSKSVLPIILAGQNNLLDKLMFQTSKPLASRVIGRTHLEGLKLKDMAGYLKHHLEIAGLTQNLFADEAVLAIHQGSGGLPRRANALARGVLVAAANEKSQIVSGEHVRLASTEII
jgi:type II secretory pathway predicted ATPase ExeA